MYTNWNILSSASTVVQVLALCTHSLVWRVPSSYISFCHSRVVHCQSISLAHEAGSRHRLLRTLVVSFQNEPHGQWYKWSVYVIHEYNGAIYASWCRQPPLYHVRKNKSRLNLGLTTEWGCFWKELNCLICSLVVALVYGLLLTGDVWGLKWQYLYSVYLNILMHDIIIIIA
jgi:hypothetical protein